MNVPCFNSFYCFFWHSKPIKTNFKRETFKSNKFECFARELAPQKQSEGWHNLCEHSARRIGANYFQRVVKDNKTIGYFGIFSFIWLSVGFNRLPTVISTTAFVIFLEKNFSWKAYQNLNRFYECISFVWITFFVWNFEQLQGISRGITFFLLLFTFSKKKYCFSWIFQDFTVFIIFASAIMDHSRKSMIFF